MNITELMAAVGLLGGVLVLPSTQLVKDALDLKGWWVLAVSVGLGTLIGGLLAGGGVAELQALTTYPAWASGAVLGFLAGIAASGGKAVATSVQKTGAWARAEAQKEAEVSPATGEPAPELPDVADGWESASINDLGRTRTDWPDPSPPPPDDEPPLLTK